MTPGALVDAAYLTIYDPRTRPPSFLALEAVTLACGALTLVHALRERRRGDGGALFAWVSIVVYGVCLEIASYNAFPTFVHGQFTVMLYHRKLPLYISAFYPMIIYSAQRTVRRFGLRRPIEPLVVGLAIVLVDFPFDTIGPDAGWWAWDLDDPNVHYRWFGVPVTSYYWHLTWGAILTALCRALEPRMAPLAAPGRALRFARLALALPVAAATMALGRAAFLPFDLLVPLGVPDGAILVTALVVAAALFALAKRAPTERGADRILFAIPVAFLGVHVAVLGSMRHVAAFGGKAAVVLASTALAVALAWSAQRAVRDDCAGSPTQP